MAYGSFLMGETEGKLGLVLMGRAMLSKSLIQFSVDGCCERASEGRHAETIITEN